jgi:GNAT superfamily N-acetyltransferase
VIESLTLIVTPVSSLTDLRAYLQFPYDLYRNDRWWVPPVWSEREALVDRVRNPFFQHGEAEFFLARRGGQVVGTIAVGLDRLANQYRHERSAFFGLFESIDDDDVARALFARARQWAVEKGAEALRGPFDLSSSQSGGILVEGHDCPPVVMTGHTPAYYAHLVERAGFARWGADHLAYRLDLTTVDGKPAPLTAQFLRVAEKVMKRFDAHVRVANLADWSAEIERVRLIYNESLASLSDFIPVTADEFARLGEAMRPILDPNFVLFVEVEGRAVGILVALPDINQALRVGSGLRTAWDYFRVWWQRRKIDCVSFKLLALLPSYRNSGLGAVLYREFAERVRRKGYRWVDLSLTGEDNPQTNRLAAMVGASVYKRYRTYELRLGTNGREATG